MLVGKIGDRSMEEAQTERQTLKQQSDSVQENIEKIRSSLQAGQEKVQKAREQKNKLNEEVIHIRQSMQAEKRLRDKINELYEKDGSLDGSITVLRQKSLNAQTDLSSKLEELSSIKVIH